MTNSEQNFTKEVVDIYLADKSESEMLEIMSNIADHMPKMFEYYQVVSQKMMQPENVEKAVNTITEELY